MTLPLRAVNHYIAIVVELTLTTDLLVMKDNLPYSGWYPIHTACAFVASDLHHLLSEILFWMTWHRSALLMHWSVSVYTLLLNINMITCAYISQYVATVSSLHSVLCICAIVYNKIELLHTGQVSTWALEVLAYAFVFSYHSCKLQSL